MVPEVVVDSRCEIGENPLWHPGEERVYWTDIPTARLHRFHPESGRSESFDTGDPVGGFTLQRDGSLLLFMAKGAVRAWREGTLTTLIEELPGEEDNRFNDVIADPAGRVFCGTMTSPSHPGRLYRLDTDGTVTQLLDGVGTSNGLGFTPDRRGLYYTDSRRYEITLFDYDAATGALANRRLFLRVPRDEGKPDGLTVDAEGCVWSARWDGGCLVRHGPKGKAVLRVPFPAKRVSSLTFGGDDLSDIYVTTAGGQNRRAYGPYAGALFRLRCGVRGVAEFRSNVAAPRG